jgi:hypothetical protein
MNETVPGPSFRWRAIGFVGVACAAVVLLGVVFYAPGRRTPQSLIASAPIEDRPSPIEGFDPNAAEETRNTVSLPAAAEEPREQTRERSSVREWAVIAATYNAFGAASKRAASLRSQFTDCSCSVYPAEGKGAKYYVLVGAGLTRNAADDFRSKAVAAGLPADTYVTKIVSEASTVE